ncbi:MAG: amidohydrolase family protein [Bacillota bacterium]
MIIDSHEHLGDCRVFDHVIEEEELIGALDANKVDAALVLPFPGAANEPTVHDAIAALAKKYPRRIYGVVSLNPHIDEESYFREVERCVKKLKFVGLKLHPYGHACPPGAKDADKVFQVAQDFDLPLIIHTGLGVPYALPSLIIPRAKQFPRMKIVMAHSGAYIYTVEAFIVAAECPNVYFETSWCAAHRIKALVEQFGAHRVMFGSDIPPNIATELAKYNSIGLSSAQLEQCLAGTVREVFNLS